MIHHWKEIELDIIDAEYFDNRHPHLKLYHLKPETLKHVEIIKVSDNPTNDTSLERSGVGDNRF